MGGTFINLAKTNWKAPVASTAALPTTGNQDGDAIITLADHNINIWNGTSLVWAVVGGGGASFPFHGPADSATAPNYSWTSSTNSGMRLATNGADGYDGVTFVDNGNNVLAYNRASVQWTLPNPYIMATPGGVQVQQAALRAPVFSGQGNGGVFINPWDSVALPGYGIGSDNNTLAGNMYFEMYNGSAQEKSFSWRSYVGTTITGSAGTVLCEQVQDGVRCKRVQAYLSGYTTSGGSQAFTFPTAFTHTPYVYGTTAAVAVATATTTTLTFAGAVTLTGWVFVQGY